MLIYAATPILSTATLNRSTACVEGFPKNFARIGYGNIKDMILFYTNTNTPIWNEPRQPYTEADIKTLFAKIDKDGRRYTTVPIYAPGETDNGESAQPFKGIYPPKGRHWRTDVATLEQWDAEGLIEWSENGNPRKKIFADEREGKRMQDIWEFKDPMYPVYPTEKNSDLLDLIVRTSSNNDSLVMDCFAGSGTTLKAAKRLGRNWIGIDQSDLAIRAIKEKMQLESNFKRKMLERHTLDAVFSFPAEMFYPGASAVACCMVFDLGKPHKIISKVCRIPPACNPQNGGLDNLGRRFLWN